MTKGAADVCVEVIMPATKKDIEKRRKVVLQRICETRQLYDAVTVPSTLEGADKRDTWVANIIHGQSEQEHVVTELSGDGLVVVKDYKWQNTEVVDDLYYLCLFSDMGVRSLRDLRATHLPLLRRIQDVVVPGLAEKHGASASSLLAYVHYHPTFWYFHVHIVNSRHAMFQNEKSSENLLLIAMDRYHNQSSARPCLSASSRGATHVDPPLAPGLELHNTQLRLVREQTANCIKDINALRAEVMLLKSEHESDRLSASATAIALEGKQVEALEHFEREKREQTSLMSQLAHKVTELEREWPSMREEMSIVRDQKNKKSKKKKEKKEKKQKTEKKQKKKGKKDREEELQRQSFEAALAAAAKERAEEQLREKAETPDVKEKRSREEKDEKKAKQSKQPAEEEMFFITDLHGQMTEHSERKHSSLQERMNFIENLLGDNVQKHTEELKKTQERLSELRGKLGNGGRPGEVQACDLGSGGAVGMWKNINISGT
eukprot:g16312.t1